MNIIGFDVSKDTLDCCLLKSSAKTDDALPHVKQENGITGFEQIRQWIKQHKIRKVAIVMEATGIYYEAAANYFSQFYTVYVVNPLKIKNHAEKVFSRTKTDKADAALIADYGKRFLDKLSPYPYKQPEKAEYRLSKLNGLCLQLQAEIGRHKNQIHASSDAFIIQAHQSVIDELTKQLEFARQEMQTICQENEKINQHCQRLQTIPCINQQTALWILQNLLGKEFKTANKFIAYAGLSPEIKQSGSSVKDKEKLTRLGNKRLKTALFMPALSAMRSNYFKPFVARLRANGKCPKVIVVALMRKLLKLAYYIYKTKKLFDANYKASS